MTTATQKTLEAHGFSEYNTGGGCMAMCKFLPNGKQVLVSDCDGGLDFDYGDWCVALYDAQTGDELEAHYYHTFGCDKPHRWGARTIGAALLACGVEVQL